MIKTTIRRFHRDRLRILYLLRKWVGVIRYLACDTVQRRANRLVAVVADARVKVAVVPIPVELVHDLVKEAKVVPTSSLSRVLPEAMRSSVALLAQSQAGVPLKDDDDGTIFLQYFRRAVQDQRIISAQKMSGAISNNQSSTSYV